MGDRLQKLKRMQVAAQADEVPLVQALRGNDIVAWRVEGEGGKANRMFGDVAFYPPGVKENDACGAHSIECQVVSPDKKYDCFSYGDDKVKLYRGYNYERAYTMLGCYEKKGVGPDMIYMIVPARRLHDFLEEQKKLLCIQLEPMAEERRKMKAVPGVYLNEDKTRKDKQYWTLRPEALASLEPVWIGGSIDEVVKAFAGDLK